MTYVELIVVLSIFAVTTSIALFNHRLFQERIDLKNLANDIALKVVEAQKAALSGKLPPSGGYGASWKPSYGIYFNLLSPGDDHTFIYFTDLNQSGDYTDPSFCPIPGDGGECLDKINITNDNRVTEMKVYYQDGGITPTTTSDLSINFTRPNGGAVLRSSAGFSSAPSFVEITIVSPQGATAELKIYTSGRIEIS